MCELHDCFAQNELLSYEVLGFCPVGEGQAFVEAGNNTYGGAVDGGTSPPVPAPSASMADLPWLQDLEI